MLLNSYSRRFFFSADKFTAQPEAAGMGVFGAVNVGTESSWWDYGLLRLYRKNNLLLTAVRNLNPSSTTFCEVAEIASCTLSSFALARGGAGRRRVPRMMPKGFESRYCYLCARRLLWTLKNMPNYDRGTRRTFFFHTSPDTYERCPDSPLPEGNILKTDTKEMAIQRIIAGFRPHEAPRMGDTGETDRNREGSQPLCVRGSSSLSFACKFCQLKPATFLGGLSRNHSRLWVYPSCEHCPKAHGGNF